MVRSRLLSSKRLGDGAEMCILQLVEGTEIKAEAATAPAKVETVKVKAEEVVEKTASEE